MCCCSKKVESMWGNQLRRDWLNGYKTMSMALAKDPSGHLDIVLWRS